MLEEEPVRNPELKTTVTELKGLTENFGLDQPKERNREIKDSSFEIIQAEEQKRTKWKGEKKPNMYDRMSFLKETIYLFLESQKEKRGWRGQKAYVKK